MQGRDRFPQADQHPGHAVLSVSGYSGSGKTTLLESAIPCLIARGLSVAVVKHDAHGFVADCEGKDSDRLFKAGATVVLRGPSEEFQRRHAESMGSLEASVKELETNHDLVLLEGHKDSPFPKVWLENAQMLPPPDFVKDIRAILPWDGDRVEALLAFIDTWHPKLSGCRPRTISQSTSGPTK
jgi:molybdopterin-guanine dinucleotide biosynthesis protein MobB